VNRPEEEKEFSVVAVPANGITSEWD